ncbi:MAG: phycocyanin [Cyanobacteria bacterium P01_G01_bin.54]
MLTLLETALERADGDYLSPDDLQSLEQAIATWPQRRQTYDLLQTHEAEIVAQAIARLSQNAPNRYTDDGGDRCQTDMTLVLRACANAMLLQDEELLKDRFLYWMQNIMQALRKQQINARVYQALQQAVQEQLPKDKVPFILPYLQTAKNWLST